MESAYRNVGFYLVVLPLILIAGFWIPYFSEIPTFEQSITLAVHFHALLLFTWAALLVIQPLAIRNGSFRLHRTLGRSSFILMPLIFASGLSMLQKEYGEHLASGMTILKAREAEYLSSAQLTLVAGFYCLSIIRIRRGDVAEHMRYMICIVLVLLPAGLARTFGYWFERQSIFLSNGVPRPDRFLPDLSASSRPPAAGFDAAICNCTCGVHHSRDWVAVTRAACLATVSHGGSGRDLAVTKAVCIAGRCPSPAHIGG